MPADDLGYFLATGVENPLNIRYQDTGGFYPGAITFTMAPQRRFDVPEIDIELRYQNFRYRLTNCKILNVTETHGSEGLIWQVTAVDRRWKWEEHVISGIYNRFLENGALWKRTEKNPRQLLKLLFDVLGEKVDVSKVDIKPRPQCEWLNSRVILEADKLCQILGCRLIHTLKDTYAVVPVGEGKPIPVQDGIATYTRGLTLPTGPDKLKAIFRPRYEVDLRLEPVGIEEDGTLKPIDELSYKPTAGWDGEYPGEFSGVVDKMEGDRYFQELARRSVWRYFQITTDDKTGGALKIPNYKGKPITKIEELLPIFSESVAFHKDLPPNDFYNYRTMPLIWGMHVNGSMNGRIAYDTNANSPNAEAWRKEPFDVDDAVIEWVDFSVDCERGLFIFNEPIYAYDLSASETGFKTPKLTARVCITLRDPKTLGEIWYEYEKKRNVPQRGTGARIIPIDDITADFWFIERTSKVDSNEKEVKKVAEHYMSQIEKEYQSENPHTVTFNDWRPIAMSGAITEVTWERTAGGVRTSVSYNDRHQYNRPSYEETRLLFLNRHANERSQSNIRRYDLKDTIKNWQRQRIIQEGH